MLDQQRYKEGTLRAEVHFTRPFLWAHFAVGALAVILMLFHEIFRWAAFAGLWYLISVLLIVGITSGMAACRVVLGGFFLLFSVIGVIFLGQVLPELKPEHPPLITYAILPVWLGLMNLVYATGAGLFFFNSRIRKACDIGFKLW